MKYIPIKQKNAKLCVPGEKNSIVFLHNDKPENRKYYSVQNSIKKNMQLMNCWNVTSETSDVLCWLIEFNKKILLEYV